MVNAFPMTSSVLDILKYLVKSMSNLKGNSVKKKFVKKEVSITIRLTKEEKAKLLKYYQRPSDAIRAFILGLK
jgi:hypothetical protein